MLMALKSIYAHANPVFYLELQIFAVFLYLNVPRISQIQLNKNRIYYLTPKSAFSAVFSISFYSITISQSCKPKIMSTIFIFWPSRSNIFGLPKYLLSLFPSCSRHWWPPAWQTWLLPSSLLTESNFAQITTWFCM